MGASAPFGYGYGYVKKAVPYCETRHRPKLPPIRGTQMLAVIIENADFHGETVLFPFSADGDTIRDTIRILFPGFKWIETVEEKTWL